MIRRTDMVMTTMGAISRTTAASLAYQATMARSKRDCRRNPGAQSLLHLDYRSARSFAWRSSQPIRPSWRSSHRATGTMHKLPERPTMHFLVSCEQQNPSRQAFSSWRHFFARARRSSRLSNLPERCRDQSSQNVALDSLRDRFWPPLQSPKLIARIHSAQGIYLLSYKRICAGT